MKFLKKVDLLERELRMEPVDVLMKGLQFVQAFRAFLKVVNSCFGMSLRDGLRKTSLGSREFISHLISLSHPRLIMII